MRMTAVLWVLAAAALALWTPSAGAQQATPPAPASGNQPLVFDLPPPADAGKPRYFSPRDLPSSSGCAALLDCRLKVIGAIQHNGAVELNGAVFKW
jgi:hypothetical protein